MGELGGFLKIERSGPHYRDPSERIADYKEFLVARPAEEISAQGARCMDCGIPFCHNGCPLGNLIPDWNDLVYRDRWFDAIRQLHATNNFPEFTGRLCPAPCEAACVLEIREGDAVTIKQIENTIIDRAWEEGWVGAGAAFCRDRVRRRRRRRGPGGDGVRPAAAPRGPSRRAVRARRGRRRARPLRGARLQDREVGRRAARAAAARRGRRRALRRGRRRRRLGRRAPRPSSTRSCCAPARACRATCRSPAASSTGIHFAMDYLYGRNRWVADASLAAPDLRGGQARRRHRRRRHRRGLRRERRPRGRAVDHAARAAARAAAAPARRQDAVAAVAAEVPAVVRDGGGEGARQGRAGLLRRDHALLRRRERRGARAARRPHEPGGPVRPAAGGHRLRDQGRPRPARDGLPLPRARPARRPRRREGPARQREGPDLRDLRPRRLRRRRRPPRPVADRVGDQRGPPGRPDGRAPPRHPRARATSSPPATSPTRTPAPPAHPRAASHPASPAEEA